MVDISKEFSNLLLKKWKCYMWKDLFEFYLFFSEQEYFTYNVLDHVVSVSTKTTCLYLIM